MWSEGFTCSFSTRGHRVLKAEDDTSQVLLGEDALAGGQNINSRGISWRPEGIWKVWGDGSYSTDGGLDGVTALGAEEGGGSLKSFRKVLMSLKKKES